jgi:hypothetical protein
MYADQRKTAISMDLGDIGNQPSFRCMTTRTISSQSLIVHVGMTGIAIGFCFRKYQTFVAQSAINISVLSL